MFSKKILLLIFILRVCTGFSQVSSLSEQVHSIHSNILNEDRTYQVYLPADYQWALTRSYPVMFLLDGESNFLHTAGSVSFLSSCSEIPGLIIVSINSTVRIRDYTQTDWSSHWKGGGGAKNFRGFLSAELIPEIEKTYRTNGFRILSGHSAAGQFALYVLSSESSLFNAYFVISPDLTWDDHLPQRSLSESFEKADSLKGFLYFAWSDDAGAALDDDLKLLEVLKTKAPGGLRWISRPFPEETHSSVTLFAQVDALRQLYSGYRLHPDLLDKGLAFAENHFKKLSELAGYEIPVPEDIINELAYNALFNGQTKEAIDLFRRNVKENPNSANAFDSLADAYDKAGLLTDAFQAAEKAIELARRYRIPGSDDIIEHAGRIRNKAAEGKH